MTIKEAQAIINLYDVNPCFRDTDGNLIPVEKQEEAFDLAAQALNLWDAVDEEVRKRLPEICRDNTGKVLGYIINKHLSEVEK